MAPPLVETDQFGCLVVIIRSSHLDDFQSLLKWINERGFSELGILKIRLHHEDREDKRCVQEIINTMQQKFNESTNTQGHRRKFVYNPSCQTFYKASLHDHVYELRDEDCTSLQRKKFVDEAIQDSHYKHQVNCCTASLSCGGLQHLKKHLFETIQQSSGYVDTIQKPSDTHSLPSSTPIIYGAGIPVNPRNPVHICKSFTMIDMDDIISQQDEKFDGISYPYIYSSSVHSLFPWHIEDVALYSLNYIAKGSMKIWFGIPSSQFGLVDQIAQSFRISKSHSACRVLLGDHKSLVADPQYFKDHHGVPYTTVIQEEGDFVMTFPYALHAGFNTGNSLAIAANFADVAWIPLGIYAPSCNCYEHQVKFDFTKILRKYRPELLNMYLEATSLMFPSDHPRQVRRILTQFHEDANTSSTSNNDLTEPGTPHLKNKSIATQTPLLSQRFLPPSKDHQSASVTEINVHDTLLIRPTQSKQISVRTENAASSTDNAMSLTTKNPEILMPSCNLCESSFHPNEVNHTVQSSTKWYCKWCAKIQRAKEESLKTFDDHLSRITEERLLHQELTTLRENSERKNTQLENLQKENDALRVQLQARNNSESVNSQLENLQKENEALKMELQASKRRKRLTLNKTNT